MSGKFRAGTAIALALLMIVLMIPTSFGHRQENIQDADAQDYPSASVSTSGLSLALEQSLSVAEENLQETSAAQQEEEPEEEIFALPYDGYVPGTDVEMPVSDLPYMAVIYIGSQRVVIYEKDEEGHYTVPHYVFTVSTGLGNNTPRGTFRVAHRWRWLPMHGIYCQYVTQWWGDYLFHSVMYSRTNPSTIDRDAYSNLGQKASAGCIRMPTRDAKWIYDNLERGTYVISTNAAMPDGMPGSEGVPPMTLDVRWDPTDPTEGNPYHALPQSEEAPMPTPAPTAQPETKEADAAPDTAQPAA